MKTSNKSFFKKVRVRTNHEEYYTLLNVPSKEIEGVMFLPVVKQVPSQQKTQPIHYIRKDSVEFIK